MAGRFQKQVSVVLTVLLAFVSISSQASAKSSTLPASKNPFNLEIENQDCSNLDVVFIVDQSWSMYANGTSDAADPLEQRKNAVDAMIDLLTGLALDQCPGTHHRIAVISYGDKSQLDLPFYDINPSTTDQANALRDENGIKRSIKALNLGGNNPEEAFVQAERLWRTSLTVDDDKVRRKKVVIFFTNGISNTPQDYAKGAESVKKRVETLFPYDDNLLALETCLAELRKKSEDGFVGAEEGNACMSAHPVTDEAYKNSTYIWTVFLKPPGYHQFGNAFERMISQYREMSEDHGGRAIELQPNSRKEIPSTFRSILSSLAGVRPTLLNCGNFAMNAYLREARLVVYKIAPDIKITLSYVDQNGTRYSLSEGKSDTPEAFRLGSKGYYSYGTNEAYTLSYPYGGIWELTADNCQGLDVYYEKVKIDTLRTLKLPEVIPQYEVEPFYDPEHPQFIEYEMFDSTGEFIPQADHPRFKVDARAQVTSPTGEQKEYILEWNAEDKIFRATDPLFVAASGTYTVHLVGTSYEHEGKPSPLETVNPELVFGQLLPLFEINSQFEVLPVTPFTIDVVDPPQDTTLKNVHNLTFDRWVPLDVAPLPIRIRLLDRDGNMIPNPEEYLKTVQDVFTVHAEGEGQVSETVKLQPDPNNPGYFTGEIPNFAVVGGKQKVVVAMDANAMLKERRPYNREVESDFVRVDDLFHTAGFWQALLAAVIAYIIISIIVYFAVRTNKVSGTLYFHDGSVEIAQFNLAKGKNWRVIKERELKNYLQLNLKKITAANSARKRAPKLEGEFAGTSFGGDTQPGIRVSCIALDGRKFEFDLAPEIPFNYDNESSISMMYQPLQK